MKPRFPLYLKILGLFFLNLLLLTILFAALLNTEFRFGLESIISSGASERVNSTKNVVVGELNLRPQSEWNEILKRLGTAYQVQFFLVNEQGTVIAGESTPELPREIVARIVEMATWRRRPITPENPTADRTASFQGPRGNLFRMVVWTQDPTRYWLPIRTRVNQANGNKQTRVTLVLMSESLSAGGLLFDYKPWVMMGVGGLLISAIFWFPFVRRITKTIVQMQDVTARISEGSFNVRVDAKREDELGLLGKSVDHMASRLENFVGGQKRFLGDIAHELCSPLSRLQLALEILENRGDESQKKYVQTAAENARQMADLVNELLSFSKASLGAKTMNVQKVSLLEIVNKAIRREFPDRKELEIAIPETLLVSADPDTLLRAVANVLRNAVQHGGEAGPIHFSASEDQGKVILTISDQGPGVPEADLQRIFDPFYRVDLSRDRKTGGTGLGLTIVKTCLESFGGIVTAQNRSPKGLEIRLILPSA